MMKNISLTFKITLSFIAVSALTLVFLYFVFYNLFQERMLESEREKAILIAKTIEPMIGMGYYLGIRDDIQQISRQTIENKNIDFLHIVINKEEIFIVDNHDKNEKDIHIKYSIKDPISQIEIGFIEMNYLLNDFYHAFEDVKSKIIRYLAALALIFFIFALVTRSLLSPLREIANKVKSYTLGSAVEFDSIRTEPETALIIDAFKRMISNIREYTVLLERYKYAVDESAIVSKTDVFGRITYVNDEFCRVSGYDSGELIGESHGILHHTDMHKKIFVDMWATLEDKKIWKGVIKNKSKNGTPYYVKTIVVPIFDENGETIEYMGVSHDITKIILQQEQIARQTTDLVTGLPNRIKLEEDIKNFKTPKFALIDLDNFHIIKEYYGYEIGNFTLKDTANMLENYIEDKNIKIYTLSSGEFGVLVGDNIDVSIFQDICNDILKKIDDYIVHVNDDSFNIQATAGLTYSKTNTISNASLALRHARETRKHSIVYEETDNLIEYYENNIKWTKRLKNALNDNRVTVYVQPIVDAHTLKTDKYECLVRMIDEDGSIVSPFHFLDIAKKSKLYLSVTQRVIAISFEVFSKLPRKSFSINLSLEDLTDMETMDYLKRKIKEYDIASRLVLEIVESEGIDNFDEIIPLVAEFKKLGCKISIDDFGTGYSNFAYLMQLNVDYIKIDGSLIKSIDHDVNSQIITHTIIDFAKQLELKTVAEFIHNESVMSYMQDMDIDYLQGFHLGEPIPIDSLIK